MRPVHAGLIVLFAVACGDADLAPTSETGDPSNTSTTTTDPTTTDPTTGDDTEAPPPVCLPDSPGGTFLNWKRSGDELPGFIGAVASNAAADTIVVGTIKHPDAPGDSYLQLYDASGDPLWSDIYAGTHGLEDQALDVAVDGAGFINVLVKERVQEVVTWNFTSTDDRLVILRYAPDGRHMWRWEREREPVVPGGYYDPTGRLGIADDGRILLLESSYEEPTVLIALDSAGNLLTQSLLATPADVTADQRAIGPDGSVYLAGNIEDGIGGHPMWIARFAADGSLAWSETFGTPKQDAALALTAGRDGEVYLAHTAKMPGHTDYVLRRHDPDGALAWTAILPLTDTYAPTVPGSGLHCDGSPLLAGGIGRLQGPDDAWPGKNLWAARYQADGAPTWTFEQVFDLPVIESEASRIAGAADGDVIVAGSYLFGEVDVPWLGHLSSD